ncbi:early light-induced protein 1, chloroplastic-like isoform X2 [Rhododendron vialii]|uniref:early light-induced protein 1, chloroplastic-like isoform X2 n=1 Tax=Rhododendron vialii TaxID=182163 RepID=UPI00265E4560|nr:early light-induced protein 1, chloroplastic-like isoform X2 [Rhododendron vialii]
MATSSVMQFILVSPVTGVAKGAGLSPTIPRSCYLPRQGRNSGVLVRCMAKDGKKEEVGSPSEAKVRTDFFNLLAFSGPGPERINGRLAMVGFVAAIAVELSKGEDVFAQISNGGIPWFLLTTGVLSVASLIPLSSGVSVESKSKPFWSSDAEMWNGRFAMLGLVALALTEFVKGGALV